MRKRNRNYDLSEGDLALAWKSIPILVSDLSMINRNKVYAYSLLSGANNKSHTYTAETSTLVRLSDGTPVWNFIHDVDLDRLVSSVDVFPFRKIDIVHLRSGQQCTYAIGDVPLEKFEGWGSSYMFTFSEPYDTSNFNVSVQDSYDGVYIPLESKTYFEYIQEYFRHTLYKQVWLTSKGLYVEGVYPSDSENVEYLTQSVQCFLGMCKASPYDDSDLLFDTVPS